MGYDFKNHQAPSIVSRWLLALFALSMLLLGFVLGLVVSGDLASLLSNPAADTVDVQTKGPASPPDSRRQDSLVANGRFRELATLPDMNLARFQAQIAGDKPLQQRRALQAWDQYHGVGFESLMAQALLAGEEADWSAAIELLFAAAHETGGVAQDAQVEQVLAEITGQYAKELIAANRVDTLDTLYERITFTLPELADYYLKLGELRIRMGRFDDALPPLAQIQQHTRLGVRARELMEQGQASGAFESDSLEQLPLRTAGSQYIVDAVIDGAAEVALLIDTGAAMTILDTRVMAAVGYNFGTERAYFRTANGVVEAPVVTLHHLSLGSSGINQLSVGVLDLDLPTGIDGLLGMNFLRHFEFRIDQEGVILHLQTAR
ncbi:MAG: retropepsin-like aspartic protease [Pseudomonadales bacterium]